MLTALILIENRAPLQPTEVKALKQDFASVLVSVCPNESGRDAFRACIMTGTRVLLGREAFLDPKHRQYFRQCIEPLVQQNACNGLPHYRYPEPLNEEPMQRRLARANCLPHSALAPKYLALYNSIGTGRSAVRPLEVLYG